MSESALSNERCTCTVEVSPDEVDAGANITLVVQVTCPSGSSLRAPRVSIRDQADAELVQAELAEADDEDDVEDDADYVSDEIIMAAPGSAGEHVYRAVVLAADKDGALHEQASADVRFVVTPHATEVNAWDIPSAIEAGSRFKFMVGVSCTAGCCLAGEGLRVIDHEDAQRGAADLGNEVWPETDALYVAEIEAEAPSTAGTYQWEIRTAAWDRELPHAAGSLSLSVRVVNAPDYEVTVEAVDREKQTPITGARVIMHPYRATTDESGVARLKVTKGTYDIMVSARKYQAMTTTADVTADMTTRAEMDEDPPWVSPEEDIGV